MGEVYRGRDTRLDRTVAIKILPAHLSSNPEFRQRFDREARTISSLQHPHICTLYDVGRHDGIDYLVLEFLEGETLADRLQKGPLPPTQVLKVGVEIADALARAHRQGIVHRDLKPGNVFLTRSGAKLTDFGLAKPAAAAISGDAKTLASGPPLTGEGTVMGTFEYMSPEQLQGIDADTRSDIFALGAVLYEMTTGRRAFEGKSPISVLAAILEREPPPVAALQPTAPPPLDRVIRACLEKDPEKRLQTAHDVGLQLAWIAEANGAGSARVTVRKRVYPWILLSIGVVATAVALTAAFMGRGARSGAVLRSYILPPEHTQFVASGFDAGPVVVSPDGRRVAFAARDAEGRTALWVRRLDSLRAESLAGTEGATYPFWSPDNRYLGFFAYGKLKKVDVSDGSVQTLCDANAGRGGSWGNDGTILFAPGATSGIKRIPAAGGMPTDVTELEGGRGIRSHRWPQFLPDGRHFLYFAQGLNWGLSSDNAGIYVGDLGSKHGNLLMKSQVNATFAAGYLLYVRETTLLAQPFDAARLQLRGEPRPVAEHVLVNWSVSRAYFWASDSGILVFHGGGALGGHQLAWFDRSGRQLASLGEPADYGWARISPDGKRVVVQTTTSLATGAADIWIFDLVRGTKERLTFGAGTSFTPVWSPDGSRIYYSAARENSPHIYAKASNGVGGEQLVYDGGGDERVRSISPDGRFLFFDRLSPSSPTKQDIWVLPLSGEGKPFPLVQTDAVEIMPFVSPDGKWVSYVSDESGHPEVYVTSFPGAAGKWQVSSGGGQAPRWRPDGKELFYLADDGHLMAVEVRSAGSSLSLGAGHPLFQVPTVAPNYGPVDITPDGSRFLINTIKLEPRAEPATLVVNWPAELKK